MAEPAHQLGMGAPPTQAWAHAMELEKRLKSESRKRSFWDPEVRRLRLSLQQAYEAVIFTSYEYAVENDVEQLIWKSVHYRPIEEFRSRLRIAGQAVQQQQQQSRAGPAMSMDAAGGDPKVQQQKLMSAYLKFLDEAIASYKRLVWKLQWVYGNVGAAVELDASVQNDIMQSTRQALGVHSVSTLVHKFLIYLGDLNRYQATAMKGSRTEWQRAISWYRCAAGVCPSSGNPFNQLAVMSFQSGDELRAVYFYFRSLGVAQPFATARENLLLLFEKNRAKYSMQLPGLQARALPHAAASPSTVMPDLGLVFVRLYGLLFDRINLEQYSSAAELAFSCLGKALGDAACRDQLQRSPPFDHFPLHLVVLSAYTSHMLLHAPPALAQVRSHGVSVLLRLGTALCLAAAAAPWEQQGHEGLMVGVHVLLQLLQCHPGLLPGAAAAGGQEAAADGEEAAQLSHFCDACSRLVEQLVACATQRGFQLAAAGASSGSSSPSLPLEKLPEDGELAGFGPLQAAWQAAASMPPAAAGTEAVSRARRILALMRFLAETLPISQDAGTSRSSQHADRAVLQLRHVVQRAVTGHIPQEQQQQELQPMDVQHQSVFGLQYAAAAAAQPVASLPQQAAAASSSLGRPRGPPAAVPLVAAPPPPPVPSGALKSAALSMTSSQQDAVAAAAAMVTAKGTHDTDARLVVGSVGDWAVAAARNGLLSAPAPLISPFSHAGSMHSVAGPVAAADVSVPLAAAAAAVPADEDNDEEVVVYQPRPVSESAGGLLPRPSGSSEVGPNAPVRSSSRNSVLSTLRSQESLTCISRNNSGGGVRRSAPAASAATATAAAAMAGAGMQDLVQDLVPSRGGSLGHLPAQLRMPSTDLLAAAAAAGASSRNVVQAAGESTQVAGPAGPAATAAPSAAAVPQQPRRAARQRQRPQLTMAGADAFSLNTASEQPAVAPPPCPLAAAGRTAAVSVPFPAEKAARTGVSEEAAQPAYVNGVAGASGNGHQQQAPASAGPQHVAQQQLSLRSSLPGPLQQLQQLSLLGGSAGPLDPQMSDGAMALLRTQSPGLVAAAAPSQAAAAAAMPYSAWGQGSAWGAGGAGGGRPGGSLGPSAWHMRVPDPAAILGPPSELQRLLPASAGLLLPQQQQHLAPGTYSEATGTVGNVPSPAPQLQYLTLGPAAGPSTSATGFGAGGLLLSNYMGDTLATREQEASAVRMAEDLLATSPPTPHAAGQQQQQQFEMYPQPRQPQQQFDLYQQHQQRQNQQYQKQQQEEYHRQQQQQKQQQQQPHLYQQHPEQQAEPYQQQQQQAYHQPQQQGHYQQHQSPYHQQPQQQQVQHDQQQQHYQFPPQHQPYQQHQQQYQERPQQQQQMHAGVFHMQLDQGAADPTARLEAAGASSSSLAPAAAGADDYTFLSMFTPLAQLPVHQGQQAQHSGS